MVYPKAYVSFLIYFHGNHDYFECHEVLEEHWKKEAYRDRNSHWVGLIQLAVALYHYRRGNQPGAIRMITKAKNKLTHKIWELKELGMNTDKLFILLEQTQENMLARKPFTHINLPLEDQKLIKQCMTECHQLGFTWCSKQLDSRQLIDKHLVRDRTEVIFNRYQQLEIRLNQK